VFGPECTQEMVYEDVSDLVVSAADGYNVCIIAYGQTGSGKTYTMMGSADAPGINMRALKELFSIGETRSESFTTTFSASILEIYNENIFDLLASAPRESAAKLDIKETKCAVHIVFVFACMHVHVFAVTVSAIFPSQPSSSWPCAIFVHPPQVPCRRNIFSISWFFVPGVAVEVAILCTQCNDAMRSGHIESFCGCQNVRHVL
jgi:hypothetical protein